MPVRRGHVAPQSTFIDVIIRKFDGAKKNFLMANAVVENCPIIYCNDGFCRMIGYTRAEIMQQSCWLYFLHGPLTNLDIIDSAKEVRKGLGEKQVEIIYYRKDGSKFLCSQLISPVKNEDGNINMIICGFDNISDPALVKDVVVVKNNNRIRKLAFHLNRHPKVNKSEDEIGEGTSLTNNDDIAEERSRQDCFEISKRNAAGTNLYNRLTAKSFPVVSRDNSIPETTRSDNLSLKCISVIPWVPGDNSCATVETNIKMLNPGLRPSTSLDAIDGKKRRYQLPRYTAVGTSSPLSNDLKTLPNASSDTNLSRLHSCYHYPKSNSLASFNVNDDYSRYKDNSHGSVASKFYVPALNKHHVGEKVAQVLSLGEDVLPEYKLETPRVHKWTILHYSPFKAVWDWIILILVIYTAVFTPYVAAFALSSPNRTRKRRGFLLQVEEDPIVIIDLLVDVMFIIDILINFRTTYINGNDEVVSHPGKVAINYLRGWFLIDLVAAIPFDLLLVGSNETTDETTTLIGLLKTARLLRLVRVARKIDRYSEYGAAVLLLLVAAFALMAHWLACIWYAIGNAERPHLNPKIGWLDHLANASHQYYNNSHGGPTTKAKYVTALYFTFSSLTSVGFGNVSPNTNTEKIFSICVMLIGSLMYASIFGNVSAIIQRLYSGTARYHTQMLRVKEFIRFHQIPNPLRQRLEEYFQHAWTYTNGIDMNMVLKGFPECLQADICLHLNRNLLEAYPAFAGATPGCLRALSMKFKTTHAPPGDTLVHRGDVLPALYFISRGSIEILKEDIVMAILGKDDVFGENPCIYRTIGKSSCNVRALTYCDLHKINREDLLDVLEMYPEFYESLVTNLEITFCLRDEETPGVAPEVMRHKINYGGRGGKSSDTEEDGRTHAYKLPRIKRRRLRGNISRRRRRAFSDEYSGYSDDDDDDMGRESGGGILEMSPEKAGLDVTPANFEFETSRRADDNAGGPISSIAGMLNHIKRSISDLTKSEAQSRNVPSPSQSPDRTFNDITGSVGRGGESPLLDESSGVSSSTKVVASSPPELIIPMENFADDESRAVSSDFVCSTPLRRRSYDNPPPAVESTSSDKKSTSSMTIPLSSSSPSSNPFIDDSRVATLTEDDIKRMPRLDSAVSHRIDQLSRQMKQLEAKVSGELQTVMALLQQLIQQQGHERSNSKLPSARLRPVLYPRSSSLQSKPADRPVKVKFHSLDLPRSESQELVMDSSDMEPCGQRIRPHRPAVPLIPETMYESPPSRSLSQPDDLSKLVKRNVKPHLDRQQSKSDRASAPTTDIMHTTSLCNIPLPVTTPPSSTTSISQDHDADYKSSDV
ncbi:KCNH7 (predicted) [Pycnogonum litorale]